MRIVDLPVALKAGIASDPPSMLPKIEYQDHKQGAQEFAMWFPGFKPEHFLDGEGAATEHITFTTHHGTKVSCFPVKIEAAWAGWTRCVASLDN